jgi:hypothetical protein
MRMFGSMQTAMTSLPSPPLGQSTFNNADTLIDVVDRVSHRSVFACSAMARALSSSISAAAAWRAALAADTCRNTGLHQLSSSSVSYTDTRAPAQHDIDTATKSCTETYSALSAHHVIVHVLAHASITVQSQTPLILSPLNSSAACLLPPAFLQSPRPQLLAPGPLSCTHNPSGLAVDPLSAGWLSP